MSGSKPKVHLGIEWQPGPNGGIAVQKVKRFGSAGRAGIKIGDEIVAIEGQPMNDVAKVQELIENIGVGGQVTIGFLRTGKREEVVAKLVELKELSLDTETIDQVLERKIAP